MTTFSTGTEREVMVNSLRKKFSWGFFVVILLAFLPLFDLLNSGLPVTHDGTDHAARIANFYNSLSDGVLFPRWAENLNWGYGHPILMFLYPFSSYVGSFLHFLGFSYVDSLKIMFGVGFVMSGCLMYLWAKEQFGEYFAVIASVAYMFAPYRFVDLYVRGAIGEHMAFIFPPLILYFLLKYFKGSQKFGVNFLGISVSFALLLLSHNAISLMFLPVFASYVIFLGYRYKKYKYLIWVILSLCVGLALSAFFTIPAFFEGRFTLRDIVIGDEYKTRFIQNPIKLLIGDWNYGITGQFTTQIGYVNILGLVLLPIFFLKSKVREHKLLISLFLLFALISIFLTLYISNFIYEIVTTFKKFQFPWRFLSLAAFGFSVVTPSIILLIKKQMLLKLAVITLLFIAIVPTISYWQAKEYKQISDSFYDSIYYGTTDTGESAPIWSVRFMEKESSSPMEFIEGNGTITSTSRNSVRHSYAVTADGPVRIRENTLYFPGWTVYANNVKQEIEFQDPSNRGLITFRLQKGSHNVDVVFEDTKLRKLSNIISAITFCFIFAMGVYIAIKRYGKKGKK